MGIRFGLLSFFILVCPAVYGQVKTIGIIGLDTSHSTAFTELLNSDSDDPAAREFEVVAAYPYGSKVIESSYKRIPAYTEAVQKYGVEIVGSVAELCAKVDYVLLETNDGHPHPEQALEVFKAGKTCFIDKPVGATLGETLAIYEMAARYGVPVFSSSALRFSPKNVELRSGVYGVILGADCYSPHKPEPTHPDFGFYGIHGVETLYTLMGTGCKTVTRLSGETGDVVTGLWGDGRVGTFRAVVSGPSVYGGTAITGKGAVPAGGYAGYKVLLDEILEFFKTGVPPVSSEETIEIYAFMKASNMSRDAGGRPVTIQAAMKEGRKDARKLLKALK